MQEPIYTCVVCRQRPCAEAYPVCAHCVAEGWQPSSRVEHQPPAAPVVRVGAIKVARVA